MPIILLPISWLIRMYLSRLTLLYVTTIVNVTNDANVKITYNNMYLVSGDICEVSRRTITSFLFSCPAA